MCFHKIMTMTQLKKILKNGSSSQKAGWNCKKDLASWDRLDSVWKSDSQRFPKVHSTHKIPTFFLIKAQSRQFINPRAGHQLCKWCNRGPWSFCRKPSGLGDWALSLDTVRQVSVHRLSEDCDPVSLALGISGRPRNLLMTSSLLMTAVAFNSSPLLSPKLSVSLGWLPPTSFVFEEKVWPFSHW